MKVDGAKVKALLLCAVVFFASAGAKAVEVSKGGVAPRGNPVPPVRVSVVFSTDPAEPFSQRVQKKAVIGELKGRDFIPAGEPSKLGRDNETGGYSYVIVGTMPAEQIEKARQEMSGIEILPLKKECVQKMVKADFDGRSPAEEKGDVSGLDASQKDAKALEAAKLRKSGEFKVDELSKRNQDPQLASSPDDAGLEISAGAKARFLKVFNELKADKANGGLEGIKWRFDLPFTAGVWVPVLLSEAPSPDGPLYTAMIRVASLSDSHEEDPNMADSFYLERISFYLNRTTGRLVRSFLYSDKLVAPISPEEIKSWDEQVYQRMKEFKERYSAQILGIKGVSGIEIHVHTADSTYNYIAIKLDGTVSEGNVQAAVMEIAAAAKMNQYRDGFAFYYEDGAPGAAVQRAPKANTDQTAANPAQLEAGRPQAGASGVTEDGLVNTVMDAKVPGVTGAWMSRPNTRLGGHLTITYDEKFGTETISQELARRVRGFRDMLESGRVTFVSRRAS